MTVYAILHKNDPERCIRFFRQYCDCWCEDNAHAIRNFFKYRPFPVLSDYPYCKVENSCCVPCVDRELDEGDTFIDFENNPRRRFL